jgi:hypothetical protein
MLHLNGTSRPALTLIGAMALSVPFAAVVFAPEASATPVSDDVTATLYKACVDYCVGGAGQDYCKSSCTCSARQIQKTMTLEEAMQVWGGQGTPSPELQSRADAITKQCS